MRKWAKQNKGFTLIEILVVITISIILMGLIMYPVVQSFKLTRGAQAMVDSQDAARNAMEMISRELGEAMFVYDNTSLETTIKPDTALGTLPGSADGPILLPVRKQDGTIEWFTLPNARIDFILPKMMMHCNNPNHPDGSPRDYPRGDEAWPPCPVCGSTNVDAKPQMPLQQESTVVRYFLGLRYNDPRITSNPPTGGGVFGWKSPWNDNTELGEENQVVLYRVEFDPSDNTLFPSSMSVSERLNDPAFFYRADTCENWMRIAHVVGVGKYEDLVEAEYDSTSGNVTKIEPSITFKFTTVNNDTFAGMYSQDKNSEYPDTTPAVFEGNYGYWTPQDHSVTVYRENNTIAYTTGYSGNDLVVFKREYVDPDWSSPVVNFNISQYLADGSFTNGGNTPIEMAMTIDLNRGRANFAMTPPKLSGENHASVLDPAAINKDFYDVYDGLHGRTRDPGSARRMATLATFDSSSGDGIYLENAKIVPGTEKVIAPDMTPGAGYGKQILYERVPFALGDPGINQYKIDYDRGKIYFSDVYDQRLPETYNGSATKIYVDYKIYFNQQNDVVKGDYTTKSMITIHMGMRMFNPEDAKAYTVNLNNSVKVRNALR